MLHVTHRQSAEAIDASSRSASCSASVYPSCRAATLRMRRSVSSGRAVTCALSILVWPVGALLACGMICAAWHVARCMLHAAFGASVVAGCSSRRHTMSALAASRSALAASRSALAASMSTSSSPDTDNWQSTARHGAAWRGAAWHGMARHGTAWHGMARRGTAWHERLNLGHLQCCAALPEAQRIPQVPILQFRAVPILRILRCDHSRPTESAYC